MGFEKAKIIKESVTLTIDGKEITVPYGKMVVEAALENGIYIPTLCWLKKLSPIGSCRICVVEVEGASEPMTSCQLPAEDGLVITTNSDALSELRKTLIKMVLVNHPLDCPVCERCGECELQNMTFELGASSQENSAVPVKRSIKNDWGLIRYYPHLCVLCERCIRVCREIQGFDAYRISSEGYSSVIDTKDGKPLDCEYCGQCVSVCPVGALNSSLILAGRSWDFNKVRTICGYCAVGCTLVLDLKRDRLIRVSSDDDAGINNGNLCVRGRFGYEFVNSGRRIRTPLIKRGDRLVPATWDEALTVIISRLKAILLAEGGKALAGIGSERALNEDSYLFQKFFRTILKSNNIDNLTNMRNDFFGSRFFGDTGITAPGNSRDIESGDLILAFGADPGVENPVIGNMVRKAVRSREAQVLIAHYQSVVFKPAPDKQILYRPGSEAGLINGIAKLVIENPAFKKSSVSIGNYKEYAASLVEVNIETVSKNSGVPEAGIKFFAQALTKSSRPVFLVGSGVTRQENGESIFYALQGLAALVSGKIVLYRDFCNTQGCMDMGVLPGMLPGYQRVDSSESAAKLRGAWGGVPETVETEKDIFEMASDGLIKGLIVMGEDPVTRYHDGKLVRKALGEVDFLVVADILPTETALLADVVLPVKSFSEREGSMTNMEGRIQKVARGSRAEGEAMADWEIINEIGRRMSDSFCYGSVGDVSAEIRDLVPLYRRSGGSGLIRYCESTASVTVKIVDSGGAVQRESDNTFLISAGSSLFHFPPYSEYGKKLSALTPFCVADMHADDVHNLGIERGQKVLIEANGSKVEVKVAVTGKAAKGHILLPPVFSDLPLNTLFGKKGGMTSGIVKKVD